MITKVVYRSKSGNTKKVADVIAQTLGVISEALPLNYPLENISILFLGAGAYGNKVDKIMIEFIKTLNAGSVKNAAIFGTNGWHNTNLNYMRDLLKAQGINVIEETYSCKGKTFFFIHRKHPSSDDLRQAQKFAKEVYEKSSH